jgi:hypothetical protein
MKIIYCPKYRGEREAIEGELSYELAQFILEWKVDNKWINSYWYIHMKNGNKIEVMCVLYKCHVADGYKGSYLQYQIVDKDHPDYEANKRIMDFYYIETISHSE